MLKLKIIIPVLGFAKAGGHRVLACLATEWKKQGHEVHFISPNNYDKPYFPTEANVQYINSLYCYLPKKMQNWFTRDLSGLLSLFFYLVKHANKKTIVLANKDITAYAVYASQLIRKSVGFYYIQAYEPDFYANTKGIKGIFSRFISAGTYKLKLIKIVNSEIYKKYKEIESDLIVAPGYDNKIFFPKRKKISDIKTIGTIGRKEEWKGTKEVIGAFRILRQKTTNLTLKVAFELPDKEIIPDGVELVFPHGDQNLADFYRSCDIIVVAVKIQSGAFHYPCLEAMTCGIPLVTSRHSPATENSAFIIDEISETNISDSIIKLINLSPDDLTKIIDKGIEVSREYTWESGANKFLQYFQANLN